MAYWLLKTDSDTYSIDDLIREKKTSWDGVRNFQARNNLSNMQKDDQALIYHSNIDKAVVGLASIVKTAYPDPTIDDDRWVAVDIRFIRKLKKPVALNTIKETKALENIALIKQSRLSVMPLTKQEFDILIKLSE